MNDFLMEMSPYLAKALGLVLTGLAGYFITYIGKKKKALQVEIDNSLANKYLDMLEATIIDCVKATNQTYVEALKKNNAFTAEAQEEAFNRTLVNIMTILSTDCVEYLETITADVDAYICNKIEAEVNYAKVD